jgi:hypothetical protein
LLININNKLRLLNIIKDNYLNNKNNNKKNNKKKLKDNKN